MTARQARLGAELRKLRELAGWSIREASEVTGIAQTKLSMTEAGKVGVSAERVRQLAVRYTCDDAALVDALVSMATERVRGWWEEYRGLVPSGYLDLAELEHHARYLRTFEAVHIPGLFQTEDQVRAIFAASVPQLSAEDVAARVRFRKQRQGVLDTLDYTAVVHEAALRIKAADAKVARDQLVHILEEAERPNVAVHVIPFEVEGFVGIDTPLVCAGGPVAQLDTFLADTSYGGEFLDAEAQLNRYRGILQRMENVALGAVESKDFIHQLVQRM
ncbi:helix-turn-helix domain-containing protein [Streptomyces sp. NPDC059785]|uniref:helix-turn-helix domain-containing protein n=1 Tax=Streptomyces sp. NPDC059785 TaxID=3346945 RepID=UPI00364CEE94